MWAPKFRDTWLNIIDAKQDFIIIEDCLVDCESGIIIKNGEIFWEAVNENIIWHDRWITVEEGWQKQITRFELISKRMREIEIKIKTKLEKVEKINCIDAEMTLHLLHPFNRYVYGHLYDTLQKLTVLNDNNLTIDSVILSRGDEIMDFNTHLDVFFDTSIARFMDISMGFVKVKKLLFINPVGHPTNFTENSFLFIRNKYLNFFEIDKKTTSSVKLFFTRRQEDVKRFIINVDEIENYLVNNGVQIITGKESLDKIVSLVHNASHIAGAHGALFMNNIFASENTQFLEFCPIKRNTRTFYDQYKICKSYQHALVDCNDSFDISIDVNSLRKFYDFQN